MNKFTAVIILALIALSGCDQASAKKVPLSGLNGEYKLKRNYQYEKIELPDGTPCYVIHGGSQSGTVGITCDYQNKNTDG